MRRLLIIELKRAFCNIWFIVPLLIVCTLAIMQVIGEVLPVLKWLDDGHRLGVPTVFNRTLGMTSSFAEIMFLYTLPIFAAIPFAGSYYSDIKSGYVKNIFTRTRRKHYFMAKSLSVFLSAAAIAMIPLLLNLYLTAMLLPSVRILNFTSNSPLFPDHLWYGMYMSNPYIYFVLYYCIISVFTGLLALFGLAVTKYVANGFLAIAAPFVLYFAVNTIFNTLGFSEYSLSSIMRPAQGHTGIAFSAILLIALLLALLSLIPFYVRGMRDDTY